MLDGKLVVGLTGMPGSGKSLVSQVGMERGYGVVTMGDIVREEAERLCLEMNGENIGRIMMDLRRLEGNSVIARRTIPRISKVNKQKIVVDGIRSLDEVEEFKRHFQKFSLIAIHASPETRFKRLYTRRRSDDAERWHLFQERDTRELSVGVGNALGMAQYIIMNEESADVARAKIKQILLKVEEEWTK